MDQNRTLFLVAVGGVINYSLILKVETVSFS